MVPQEFALTYAKEGRPVFPCDAEKHPHITKGFQAASTDETQIRAWWKRWPLALIGMPTGVRSGLVVIDIDVDSDKPGLASFAELQRLYGELPPTLTARSGGGGKHLYFRHPGTRLPNKNALRTAIDVRGDGGYIILPPSQSAKGKYAWVQEIGPADLPDAYLELLMERPKATQDDQRQPFSTKDGAGDYWLNRALRNAQEGARNARGFWLACQLRDAGISETEAESFMATYAASVPGKGYSEREALVSLRSAYGGQTPRGPAKSAQNSTTNTVIPGPLLTEMGNAQRLYARHGQNIRYSYTWKGWVLWDGKHWRRDDGDGIMRMAKDTAVSLFAVAQEAPETAQQAEIAKWAIKSQSARSLQAMVDLTRDMCKAEPKDFDQNIYLWNCPNGTTDLHTGITYAHRREDMIMKMSPVSRQQGATCPKWLANLHRFMDGNEEMVAYLQRWVGYVLTGDVSERSIEIAFGTGNNFKSTFISAIQSIWGDYAHTISTELLMVMKYDRSGPEAAQLPGVRLAIASEGEKGQTLSVARLKGMTGGPKEPMTAEAKYEKPFQFVPNHKIFFMTNDCPNIRDATNSIWNRVHLQRWNVTIPKAEINPHYDVTLEAEYSGILEWAIQGCLLWQHHGLYPPQAITEATNAYRQDMNLVAQFLAESCAESKTSEVPSGVLYTAFKAWCDSRGERAARSNDFAKDMEANGYTKAVRKDGRFWRGLRFVTANEPSEAELVMAGDAFSKNSPNAQAQGKSLGSDTISHHHIEEYSPDAVFAYHTGPVSADVAHEEPSPEALAKMYRAQVTLVDEYRAQGMTSVQAWEKITTDQEATPTKPSATWQP